ncbi:hypothetical protein SNEBB_006609 [Seison nebaliae]|nr:hypothetical protein SNEBB_006609 [Seison nebaliae]
MKISILFLIGCLAIFATPATCNSNIFANLLSMLVNPKALLQGEMTFGAGGTSEQSVEGTINNELHISSDTTGKAGGEFEGVHEGNVGKELNWY